jgi:hypothetical protein
MTLTLISMIQLTDRSWNFLFDRPTAQTRRQICACDSSKFSVFHPLLAFDILTLKMYDLDRLFQGQRWKMVHFQSKHSPSRQIRIISSSSIKTNIRRQNLFKRNFHFQGQIFKFWIFYVLPISLYDTSFCSPSRVLKVYRVLTLTMYDLDSIFKVTLVG